jgi:hypothetical protein
MQGSVLNKIQKVSKAIKNLKWKLILWILSFVCCFLRRYGELFLDCISRTSGTFNRNIKLESGYMLEPPNLKALKTIDFAFCLCKALKRAKVLETRKKQILKNNSNIFKDWTISREVKSFRLKQTV